jgi:hypothetical protein
VSAPAESRHQERLRSAAATARDVLARSGPCRWEVFTKASVTREVEVAPGEPPRELQVEEMGVAVRTVRGGRAGFAAASGLEADAARRAIAGALAVEQELPFDPLPPPHLLAAADTGPTRGLPPRGWAHHVGEQLGKSVAAISGGRLHLRRCLFQEGTFSWLMQTGEGFVAFRRRRLLAAHRGPAGGGPRRGLARVAPRRRSGRPRSGGGGTADRGPRAARSGSPRHRLGAGQPDPGAGGCGAAADRAVPAAGGLSRPA